MKNDLKELRTNDLYAGVLSEKQIAIISELNSGNNQVTFLTGQGGSGKTTVIKEYLSKTGKNVVVVAPTGIAALHIGGVTIHSALQLEPRIYLQNDQSLYDKSVRRGSFTEIRKAEVIIIDEVSMVRADLLEAVNQKLRMICGNLMPFGGKQMIPVGDLSQLPPVTTTEEVEIIKNYYESPYFFSAPVLKQVHLRVLNLDESHRQSAPAFMAILNSVRSGDVTDEQITVLNSRVKGAVPPDTITLSPYNAVTEAINQDSLKKLPDKTYIYNSKITGKFKESDYPTASVLVLKVGAQVIFLKNDQQKRFYNGSIGKVSKLTGESIWVKLENGDEIEVLIAKWEKVKYIQESYSGQLKTVVDGTFEQFPLKLGYAATIHKTQGMTLNKLHLNTGRGCFAPGQLYVALSRARSLEGITLQHPIRKEEIIVDQEIIKFYKSIYDRQTI